MRNLPLDVIDEVIIASVVPNVMHSLTNGIRKYFKLDPLIVEPGVKQVLILRFQIQDSLVQTVS